MIVYIYLLFLRVFVAYKFLPIFAYSLTGYTSREIVLIAEGALNELQLRSFFVRDLI